MQASQLFVHQPDKLKKMRRKAKKKKRNKGTKKKRRKSVGIVLELSQSLSVPQHREGGTGEGWQYKEMNPKPMNGYKITWKAFLLAVLSSFDLIVHHTGLIAQIAVLFRCIVSRFLFIPTLLILRHMEITAYEQIAQVFFLVVIFLMIQPTCMIRFGHEKM